MGFVRLRGRVGVGGVCVWGGGGGGVRFEHGLDSFASQRCECKAPLGLGQQHVWEQAFQGCYLWRAGHIHSLNPI